MSDLPFELPDGWEVKTVEQLIKSGIIEKPLDGNHGGTHPKSADYVEEGIPFVMASDLKAGRVDFKSCKFITKKQALTLRKGFSNIGDVLVSHKATIGRTAIVQNNKYDFVMLTPQLTYFRVKNVQQLNNVYLKAYFDSSFFQTTLGLWAGSGSTRAYLGITAQLKLPIIIPPIDKQLSIANHVKAINDKIELNRQTNQTLEQIAQAIFKSWFVDFEPVKAKIRAKQAWAENTATKNGENNDKAEADFIERAAMRAISGKTDAQLEQLSPDAQQQLKTTAALFPDTLVDSELGEMPEGWEVVRFKQVVEKYIDNRGKTPPVVDFGIPLLEVKHLPENSIKPDLKTKKYVTDDTYNNWFRAHLEADDIIISTVGTIGRICMVSGSDKLTIAQNLLGLRFNKEKASPYFMYYQMDGFRFRHDVDARLIITVQASIKRKDLETIDLLSPPIELQNIFEETVKPFVTMLQSNQEIELAELRDTLLPKLLSGELSLTNADVEPLQ